MYQISDLHEECRASLKSFKMSSQNYAEVFKVAMQYENFNGFEVCRSSPLFVLILAFHLLLNPDPDPGSQTNGDPDPGQIEFLHEK